MCISFMAVMSLSKMIGRLSIKGDHYSLTIQLFFSNPVFVHMKAQFKYCGQEEEAKYWNCTLTTCMVLLCIAWYYTVLDSIS